VIPYQPKKDISTSSNYAELREYAILNIMLYVHVLYTGQWYLTGLEYPFIALPCHDKINGDENFI